MRVTLAIVCLVIGLAGCQGTDPETGDEMPSDSERFLVFFGTGGKETKGIYAARFDAASGEVTPLGLVAEANAAGFLEIHPNGQWLYSVVRSAPDATEEWQGVAAYEINRETGQLTNLNHVSGKGDGPTHVTVDAGGHTVAVANYGSGSVASMPIESSGRLGEAVSFFQHTGSSVNPRRQEGPHAHSVNFSPDDRFLIVADLGIDQILIYRHDPATSELQDHRSVKVAPGSGPRHFTFHPSGQFAYVINELAGSITAYNWDSEAGDLTEIQTVGTLPEGFTEPNTTAEVLVHPSGRFLYGSNRGHDSIAVFTLDPATGKLALVEHVTEGIATPRNFRIDPTGRYLFVANQSGDNVKLFRIDQTTGRLTTTGAEVSVPGPICVRFLKVQ